jgi:hypothetical protein
VASALVFALALAEARPQRQRAAAGSARRRTAKLAVGVILDLVDLQRRLLGVRHLCGRHGDDVGLGARSAKRARARVMRGEEEKLSLSFSSLFCAVPYSKDARAQAGGDAKGKLWL